MPCLSQCMTMALLAVAGASASPSINVGMNAAFPRGPYLLELLETAAGENSTAYFPLLDKIASGYFVSAKSDAELYDQFLEVLQNDDHITTPEALSTFKLSLSLRAAAPRIEAHYQYYSTAVDPEPQANGADSCDSWALVDNSKYCSPSLDTSVEGEVSTKQVKVLPFDRVLGLGKDAILYADPASTSFGPFHDALSKAARQGNLSYRLRYRRSAGASRPPLPVSGYGVKLDLKRTDYIVIDDREGGQKTPQTPVAADVDLDATEDVADLKPLSSSELASLGLKAASFILKSENPLDALVKSTQDFPKFSASIASHEVTQDFVAEQEKNVAAGVPSGINFLWMNGVQLIERQVEPFALIEMIRRERKLIDGVRELGFSGQQAVSLLGHSEIASSKADDEPPRFDWTDRLENGKAVMWLNDLEKDARYQKFPSDLTALLQRTYPGQLPQVAINLFHVVAPVDFTNLEDGRAFGQLAQFMQRGITIRFGIVPLATTPESTAQTKVVYHLMETYGFEALITYLQESEEGPEGVANKKSFARAIDGREPLPEMTKMTLSEVLEAESYVQKVKASQAWASRLNADTTVRPIFVNGMAIPREKSWVQAMGQRLTEDQQTIQKAVYFGHVNEEATVSDLFLNSALSKRNTYIFPDDDKALRILDINKLYTEHAGLFGKVAVLPADPESAKEDWAVLTTIADLNTDDGQDLLIAALEFKRNNRGIRLDIIHNPPSPTDAHAINGAFKLSEVKLAEMKSKDDLKAVLEASWTAEEDGFATKLSNFLSTSNILPGTKSLLLNGRVVGPLPSEISFKNDDIKQLLEFEQRNRILPVYAAIKELGFADKLSDPLAAAKLTSITALSTISDLPQGIFESAPSIRSTLYSTWNSTHSAIEVGNPETASIHIAGLLNPTSEQGQRWAPILKVLSELDGVYLKLFMNPKEVIDELPIKRFFRYVLDSTPSFDASGHVQSPKALFKGLPSEALLTAGVDVPPAWLVAAKDSVQDLDNIKLSSVKADIDVTYELENILIEGHSRDGKRGAPRGAQLALATEKDPLVTDTIVMANLGYFQFKANPGFYNIQLKEGRSSKIFNIESVGAQGYAAVPGDEGTEIALMDFKGTTLYPRLNRKPGMEEVDVLESPDSENDGIVAKGLKFAESFLGGTKSPKEISAKEHAEINIFSVASGHLYERMLNIMMVSVMRNTKHTVKFWFIEQFLSPSFKEFIPHMAAEYGFKYEMVTYKWPHWLRQQKEKQREIWGYKILFLDVLFPLSLDKVIFVDADQVVRTDMMDLVNHDLEGAPYGFTPMCDSRTEMEGFRFWKQGYWANYLRGLPYHISALYVVDLNRFRQLAAGDRLRQQYHQLSADPNSLSNLDQDLPNNMQFAIPIHSLPQEWLWCETWCSDESLSNARTIDLCNNPQTKEPKLDRARRQVPEWTVYDNEIAALDRRRKGIKDKNENTESQKAGDGTHTKDEL
ncbi:UDP-glucose:glycoprotein glucosyltransferase-domain-containing protein [Fusarium flagelliforme]|uniref:Udp-glucose:glycoprotein glucosyltransferase n=1 Tax=Fusarium flagelliforme TaxID=2675880 RepID=A0A395MVS9_9HYPO|nr:UDP-glucose:glycoprotein glucosyltransferase-domain-containing protein [Fusarium flagelliforme]KAH7192547.1 UDP-glucose:glycoprotein glucosyltransferase-domain-containing protein [Fusarium flagelliforme]RFN52002.1 udp-glucose:glycoprotein glucosyltransferase [Fusarium flagelliforme]